MSDTRYEKLANLLTSYSTELKAGDRVLIDAFDVPEAIVIALVRAARDCGAHPFTNIQSSRINRELLRHASKDQYKTIASYELARMKSMDAYIALRGSENIYENSDVGAENMKLAMDHLRPVLNYRVNKTRWVVLRWPTPSMAQLASMSTEAFEEFYFRVCTLDYRRMLPGAAALTKLMQHTDRVHIKGPGTDLSFSIKNIGAVPCTGSRNIPDGEVFSCPVKDSVEGTISYNTPSVYQGVCFDDVRLVFKKGRIIEATCKGDNKRLNAIFDSDAGARYVGEFAIGFNPHILAPMKDTLFDEKIAGSFHFTPGQAYESADNGIRSQVHWDLVSIQRPDYGGGEIYFDDRLIRKDGRFVVKELLPLNPEKLIGKS